MMVTQLGLNESIGSRGEHADWRDYDIKIRQNTYLIVAQGKGGCYLQVCGGREG
jgi:hypothetical protein